MAVVALAACGGGANTGADGTPTKATGRWGQVHTNLCAAVAASTKGDATRAKRDFDDIHAALHELAAAVEREDRPAAARLLEAKQRVEAQPTTHDLRALVDTVATGIEITGGTAPDSCP